MIHLEKTPQDNVYFGNLLRTGTPKGASTGNASVSRTRQPIADWKQGNQNNEPVKHLSQRSALNSAILAGGVYEDHAICRPALAVFGIPSLVLPIPRA
jgi:hypothetical protein